MVIPVCSHRASLKFFPVAFGILFTGGPSANSIHHLRGHHSGGHRPPLACSDSFKVYSQAGTILRGKAVVVGNIGSNFSVEVEVGVDAAVNGNLVSVGNAILKSRSVVNGDVTVGGKIIRTHNSTVTGVTTQLWPR